MKEKTIRFNVQSDLFSYLKPMQKDFIRPILRLLKKPAQEELCCSLLDYLETNKEIPPDDIVLGGIFFYVVERMKSNV